ncbi:unnamed protein product [Lupinus luteus]|uniref:Uncharacterized protein n=1 Tax=Lupinus luteus TaxID=3873 RepID=A0AAV1WZQ6_LUPLU
MCGHLGDWAMRGSSRLDEELLFGAPRHVSVFDWWRLVYDKTVRTQDGTARSAWSMLVGWTNGTESQPRRAHGDDGGFAHTGSDCHLILIFHRGLVLVGQPKQFSQRPGCHH